MRWLSQLATSDVARPVFRTSAYDDAAGQLLRFAKGRSSLECSTPIVFVVFNRPETTRRVFQRIASVKPSQLLVVADGARSSKPDEVGVCAQVRAIATAVDWPCELQTQFADHNMGCRRRLVTGLNWAFQRVERAIILEDDVLVDTSFFRFCEEMLERFADDSRISMVSSFNRVQKPLRTASSYYFSQQTHIWGWASWRRAWERYDEHLSGWPKIKASGLMEEVFADPRHRAYWTHIFDMMHAGTGPDTWDYQWMYTNVMNSSMAIAPHVNLVQNIGFGPLATHTTREVDAPNLPVGSLTFPLVHPPAVVPLRSVDWEDQELSGCRVPSPFSGLTRGLKRVVREGLRRG